MARWATSVFNHPVNEGAEYIAANLKKGPSNMDHASAEYLRIQLHGKIKDNEKD